MDSTFVAATLVSLGDGARLERCRLATAERRAAPIERACRGARGAGGAAGRRNPRPTDREARDERRSPASRAATAPDAICRCAKPAHPHRSRRRSRARHSSRRRSGRRPGIDASPSWLPWRSWARRASSSRSQSRRGNSMTSPPGVLASASGSPSLELLSLRDARDANTLTITGLVENPRGGTRLTRVSVTAFAFDQRGAFLASGNALLDVTSLVARRRIAVRGLGSAANVGRGCQVSGQFPRRGRPRHLAHRQAAARWRGRRRATVAHARTVKWTLTPEWGTS